MAPQKKNEIMHWLQLFITVVAIPIFSYQAKKQQETNDNVNDIKVMLAKYVAQQEGDHIQISEARLSIFDLQGRQQKTEKEISKIEAILPESLRKKLTNF